MAVEEWTREEWATIQEAAKLARAGSKKPSADDVLMRLTPRYHISPEHTRRYHRMCDAVAKLVYPENPRAKIRRPSTRALTDAQVREIRRAYDPARGVTQYDLADRYGVNQKTIGDVVMRRGAYADEKAAA